LPQEPVLDSPTVQKLIQLVDESVRASSEGVRHFVEPTPGVLASGGVARDFLTIFSRSIQVARERLLSGKDARGEKMGVEDVNVAAGQQGAFKEEDFTRDIGTTEDRERLQATFREIVEFCVERNANCILIEKDVATEKVESCHRSTMGKIGKNRKLE
jgi:hypothetical protein